MRVKKWASIVAGLLLLLVLLFFIFRNTLLHSAFNRVAQKYRQAYAVQLTAETLQFSGISAINFTGLTIQPINADTLITIDTGLLQLKLLKLLTGSIGFNSIQLGHINVNAYNLPGRNNISFLSRSKEGATAATAGNSYKSRAANLQQKLTAALKWQFNLTALQIAYTDTTGIEKLYLPQLHYNGHQVKAALINLTNNDSLLLDAKVYPDMDGGTFTITSTSDTLKYLPFKTLTQVKCRFRQISGNIKWNSSSDKFEVYTNIGVNRFCLNHWRLAKEDITINNGSFSSKTIITDNTIELDSISAMHLGHATFKIYSRYQRAGQNTFALQFTMPEIPADTFFNCLPQGMFTTLQGISCTGTLAYRLNFFINTAQPDSLIFQSALSRKNLSLVHYGRENYGRINGPFTYEAYSKGQLMRQIMVGSENAYFTPLAAINPQLPLCVLQSEDPSFMQHNGFITESFRESIIKNYKEKRFARGGSTISMQLVKNAFLSSNKTVSRKIEEALVVYLIENLNLVSKERMLEVYLNVIEWGPNVYGIGEASRFYFDKNPAQLNLSECAFLACIIPNPRSFKYQFKADGSLQPWFVEHYNLLMKRMTERNLITGYNAEAPPVIELKGPAKNIVLPAGQPADTD